MQTEFEFELPKGYVDANGDLHRKGVMRLATAADEILPMRDPKVQQNPGYLSIILLSRVITKLGTLPNINTRVIEGLFTMDSGSIWRTPPPIRWPAPIAAKALRCPWIFYWIRTGPVSPGPAL